MNSTAMFDRLRAPISADLAPISADLAISDLEAGAELGEIGEKVAEAAEGAGGGGGGGGAAGASDANEYERLKLDIETWVSAQKNPVAATTTTRRRGRREPKSNAQKASMWGSGVPSDIQRKLQRFAWLNQQIAGASGAPDMSAGAPPPPPQSSLHSAVNSAINSAISSAITPAVTPAAPDESSENLCWICYEGPRDAGDPPRTSCSICHLLPETTQ